MVPASRIRELLNRRPFRPLRLFLSDGSRHEIPHPEFAWVFGGRVFIGVPGRRMDDAEGVVKELSLLHVTRIEERPAPASKRRR